MKLIRLAGFILGTFCAMGSSAWAADHPNTEAEEPTLRELVAPRLFDQLFDTVLPGQYRKGDWRLRLNPRFGRVLDDDYMGLMTGIRYNFSNYFDVTTDLGMFFPNPVNDGNRTDLYLWRLGLRYTWFEIGHSHFNLAAGINSELILDDTPLEVSDGYARTMPYITLSRQLVLHPNWLLYVNATYEVVHDSPFDVIPYEPMPSDSIFLRTGGIYYPGGNIRYSIELEYRTNALDYDGRKPEPPNQADMPPPGLDAEDWYLAFSEVHEVFVYPGLTWFPTHRTPEGTRVPGRWDVGLRVRVPIIQDAEREFGVSVRFHFYFDYLRYFQGNLTDHFLKGD